MEKTKKGVFERLFKRDSIPNSVDDLAFLECSEVDRIRKKLSKNFNVSFQFRWRYHPQEDISVIHYAAARASPRGISCLVEHGADVNWQTTSQGLSPLHFSVLFSNIDVMEELVNRGANINITEYGRGYTPLHYACERRNLGAVKRLLELLSDQDMKDISGRTPLQLMEAMHCDQICKILKGWKEADSLKTNVSFLAGEQRRQKEQFGIFKDEIETKFEELDYWKDMMEQRVSQAENYQKLRRSMRDARNANPMFYQDPSPSRASSISNLSEVSEIYKHKPRIRNVTKKADSVRNLVSKFERIQNVSNRMHARAPSSLSCVSINTTSTVSEYDSGLSSRPESQLSSHTEIGYDNCSDFSYEEASMIQLNYPQLIQQMCPTAVIHKLFAESKISLAFKEKLQNMNDYQKTEEILDHVMKTDCQTFHIFMQALDESGQMHLSDMIRYNKTPYIYV